MFLSDKKLVFMKWVDCKILYIQIVNLNKWRKLVHSVIKKTFTASSLLPPDLVINVKSVIIQICDDPFEVKLNDNYEVGYTLYSII